MDALVFLGIWRVDSQGRGISVDFNTLCREIEKLDPKVVGFKVLEELQADGFICTLPNGHRTLTKKGLAARKPLDNQPKVAKKSHEKNWQVFRTLCAYYIDCLTQSEKQQERLFSNDVNIKWFIPTLPIGWLSAKSFEITTQPKVEPALNRIKSRLADEEEVYIGYPVHAFRCSDGQIGYTPIMLFPVDISYAGYKIEIKIRHDEVDINRTWLEYSIPREEHKNVMMNICFTEGENTGLLNPHLTLQYLNNLFQNRSNTSVVLNSNDLDVQMHEKQKGVLNKSVLFVGEFLKYAKTLKKELIDISRQPPEILDKTALAYIFRDPVLQNQFEYDERFFPFEFLEYPSNKEQHDALTEALNKPVSKITGPPGTGKSQVAVNLIANLVFSGKSVLFTSKNHKAIHAIADRAETVSPEMPLIQFCTIPGDGSTGAVWHQQCLDSLVGICELLFRNLSYSDRDMRTLQESLLDWWDWEQERNEIDATRKALQDIAARYEKCKKAIPVEWFDDKTQILTKELWAKIEKLVVTINKSEEELSFWGKILSIIFLKKRRRQHAELKLRSLLPKIAESSKTTETLIKKVLPLCTDISDFFAVKQQEALLQNKATNLPEKVSTQLADNIRSWNKNIKDAFLFRRINMVTSVDTEIMKELKNATSRLQRQSLPFLANIIGTTQLETSADMYHQFMKCYPAWATTLLSQVKASPCIPGLFDRVIIDEASQCEIPPVIPALYRSKGVTVIGDPEQFPPVITMRETRHAHIRYIKHKLHFLDEHFDFMKSNVFKLVQSRPIMLREHFRCVKEVANYFNDNFYHGKLRVRTDESRTKFPKNMGFKSATLWLHVDNSLDDEIQKTIELIAQLEKNNYEGSIGVISPYRKVADSLKQELHKFTIVNIAEDVNTVNGFQGGERDLIILVIGFTDATTRGEEWYVLADENKYIYNVAVSRARACLLIVGDKNRAAQYPSLPLGKLANLESRKVESKSQSIGEERLYQALIEAGLAPVQQFPLAGRYLDIALVDNKIDIEVDGAAWHLNRYGERKADDVFRDLQVQSCGWKVIRFWHREVMTDLDSCVTKVLAEVE